MSTVQAAAAPRSTSSGDIVDWRPEDNAFWEATGKRIAYRNLAISVPALLCGFAVWGMWGIITVQMLNLGFPFTQAELFTLTAIAGIAGATMRIPASFLIRLAGGRNTIFLTTAMLLAPAIGTGIVLQHKDWPLWAFQLMALWSGVGGGNFASSMSNISTFFPKRLQGTALGINAGIGNFGVTTMQIVIPLVMTVGMFGAFGGEPMTLMKDSGWILGKINAGTPTWIQNAGFAWVLSLVPLAIAVLVRHEQPEDGDRRTAGNPIVAFAKITWLYTLAFVPSILGLYLYLPKPTGLGLISMWVAIPLDVVAALLIMKLAAFGPMKENVAKQFADLQGQAHLVDDGAVHRHLRLVHRLLDGAAAVDHGDLRHQPRARRQRRAAAHAEESERAVGLHLRLDRPLRRRRRAADRRLDLGQGRRLDRHADDLGGDGGRLGRGGLRDDAGVRARRRRSSTSRRSSACSSCCSSPAASATARPSAPSA